LECDVNVSRDFYIGQRGVKMYLEKAKLPCLAFIAFAFFCTASLADSSSIPIPDGIATAMVSRAVAQMAVQSLDVCALGCSHSTIQGAVNAAGSGSIISVAPGVYDETVYVNKPLTIQGQPGAVIRPGSSTAMLIGGGTLRAAILVDGIDGVTISGFEIDGSIAAVNYGIYFYNSQGSSAIGNTIHDMSNNAEDSAGIGLLFFGWT